MDNNFTVPEEGEKKRENGVQNRTAWGVGEVRVAYWMSIVLCLAVTVDTNKHVLD